MRIIEEHVIPCLLGRDPACIEDIWQYLVPMRQAIVADHWGIIRMAFLVPAVCYAYLIYFALQCREPVYPPVQEPTGA
jgi:hypothetical protein